MVLLQSQPIPLRPSDEPAGKVTPAETQAMLRAVLGLLNKWEVSGEDKLVLLGRPSQRTFQRWSAGDIKSIPTDTVFRLGDLLGIHKALRYMFTDVERAYRWIGQPNAAFAGHSALDVMLNGRPGDITRVRAYLDAERGGW